MFRSITILRFGVDSFGRFKKWNKCDLRSQTFTSIIGSGLYSYEGSGESVIRSLQLKIVNALRLGDRTKASTLLSDLSRGTNHLNADDFVFVLDYCEKSPDPLFVMETWRIMMEKEINANYKCYLLGVRALCKGGYLEEALNLMKFLKEDHNTFPTLPIYNSFLSACAQTQSFNYADQCLDLMESQVTGKNGTTYWILLKIAVWQQNLSAVHAIWEDYVKYYSPSFIALQHFIRSFGILRDLESAYATLQYLVVLALKDSVDISNVNDNKLYSSRIDAPIPSKNELCLTWVDDNDVNIVPSLNQLGMPESNTKQCTPCRTTNIDLNIVAADWMGKLKSLPLKVVLTWSFNDVIRTCAKGDNYELAKQLMSQMLSIGLTPTSDTYDSFVRLAVSERGFLEGIELLKIMRKKNLKPRDSTFATVSAGCSKGLRLDLAELLIDQISQSKNPHALNAFLAACDSQDQPQRAVRMLAKMKQWGLQPDIRTYELLFSLFGNLNYPYEDGDMLSQVAAGKRIKALEMDMQKNGIPHSHISMMSLLKALGREGMIREMIHYFCVAEDQLFCSSAYFTTLIYNVVLHSLVIAEESHMAIEVFEKMRSEGSMLDAATYTIMLDCCSITGCYKSACALVSLMIRDGFCPQRINYTILTKILLECDDFLEALKLMDLASLEGIETNLIFFNTIIQGASLKGRIDVMEFIVEKMYRDKIKPDSTTCSYVFAAYVNLGFESMGMEALQVLSMRMISEDDPIDDSILQEKIQEYEEICIFAEDSEAESRILQYFQQSNETLAVALLNLRWCATLGSPISWFPDQSVWARRLKSSYDSMVESFDVVSRDLG